MEIDRLDSVFKQRGSHMRGNSASPLHFESVSFSSHVTHARNLSQPSAIPIRIRKNNVSLSSVTIDQAAGAIARNHLAVIDYGNPVAKLLGFVHEMGHQNDRRSLVPDFINKAPSHMSRGRVEPGGHLVEEDQLRIVN
jgi:hypothetical protein